MVKKSARKPVRRSGYPVPTPPEPDYQRPGVNLYPHTPWPTYIQENRTGPLVGQHGRIGTAPKRNWNTYWEEGPPAGGSIFYDQGGPHPDMAPHIESNLDNPPEYDANGTPIPRYTYESFKDRPRTVGTPANTFSTPYRGSGGKATKSDILKGGMKGVRKQALQKLKKFGK